MVIYFFGHINADMIFGGSTVTVYKKINSFYLTLASNLLSSLLFFFFLVRIHSMQLPSSIFSPLANCKKFITIKIYTSKNFLYPIN